MMNHIHPHKNRW